MTEPVKLGKPDARGNYKRDLGWKVQDGQYVQHRFYVGKDRDTASRRVERLERLWDALEAAWKEQRRSGIGSPLHLGDERPVWNPFTLAVAMAVAGGDAETSGPCSRRAATGGRCWKRCSHELLIRFRQAPPNITRP